MFEILIVVLVVAGVVVIAQRKLARRAPLPRKRDAYIRLLKQTGGDDELADRLVEAERKRNPYAPEERLAELALARWMKDRN